MRPYFDLASQLGGAHEAGFAASLGVMTHLTRESDLELVTDELRRADFVGSDVRVMRVEGF